jgi:hypothetical protein
VLGSTAIAILRTADPLRSNSGLTDDDVAILRLLHLLGQSYAVIASQLGAPLRACSAGPMPQPDGLVGIRCLRCVGQCCRQGGIG